MSGGVVFWPWAECVVALFIYLSAIITKAKMTRIGACVLGEPPLYQLVVTKKNFSDLRPIFLI